MRWILRSVLREGAMCQGIPGIDAVCKLELRIRIGSFQYEVEPVVHDRVSGPAPVIFGIGCHRFFWEFADAVWLIG